MIKRGKKVTRQALVRVPDTLRIYVDEAGRGSLYGPMMMTAVCVIGAGPTHGARDSKLMTPAQRTKAFGLIQADVGITHHIHTTPAATIDRLGMATAWKHAVVASVTGLAQADCKYHVVVDGSFARVGLDPDQYTTEAVIKADRTLFGAAAAGILAKVTHDRRIQQMVDDELSSDDKRDFGEILRRGKGYWYSRTHADLLRAGRAAPDHRRSVRPLRLFVEESVL